MNSSITGIHAATARMAVSAHNVANLNTPDFKASRIRQHGRPEPLGTEVTLEKTEQAPSLTEETVEQLSATSSFKANTVALRTQDEMVGTVIDMMA